MSGKDPVNPFEPPGWAGMDTRPLCPWQRAEHRDRYLDIDGWAGEFARFTSRLGDFTQVLADGRLVLVTGETGCGKTAMINLCADWVVQARTGFAQTLVFDLLRCLPRATRSIDERAAIVSDRLVTQLLGEDTIRREIVAELKVDRERPNRVYPRLSAAVPKGAIIVVLLPPADELSEEVIRYSRELAGPGVLFMIESAHLNADDVNTIFKRLADGVPPIALRLEQLKPGDAECFIARRLDHANTPGVFPRMSEMAISEVVQTCPTVAALQKRLYGTYQTRLDQKLNYTNDDLVTEADLRAYYGGA